MMKSIWDGNSIFFPSKRIVPSPIILMMTSGHDATHSVAAGLLRPLREIYKRAVPPQYSILPSSAADVWKIHRAKAKPIESTAVLKVFDRHEAIQKFRSINLPQIAGTITPSPVPHGSKAVVSLVGVEDSRIPNSKRKLSSDAPSTQPPTTSAHLT